VSLSNATGEFGKVVIADAVRFRYLPEQEQPPADSLPVWWATHFFDGPAAGDIDADGDWYTNHEEYLLGSNPRFAGSSIHTASQIAGDGRLMVQFAGAQPDREYELQVATDLDPLRWETVATEYEILYPLGEGVFMVRPSTNQPAIYRVVARLPLPGPTLEPMVDRFE
jgi:hypothetical protein